MAGQPDRHSLPWSLGARSALTKGVLGRHTSSFDHHHQLAVNVPDFKNVLGHAIFQDPSIFHKALRIQLQKLIVEPFVLLQDRKPEIAQNPLFIIIDGLDECEGIEAQCEIVEMIEEVVRLKKDLPLR
jgi:hypothetical protein